jgi:HTH-type transcriptional regulator, competence development regulator
MNDEITPTAEHDQIILGRALRALREHAEMTQQQLAERIGIDPAVVGRIERGRRGVRWHTVRRFLRALDADLHDLARAIADTEAADKKR